MNWGDFAIGIFVGLVLAFLGLWALACWGEWD